MSDQMADLIGDHDVADSMASGAERSSLLVDSAISHCEKLRRVVELEEWVNRAHDDPTLATTCRRWQEEREQLLIELHLCAGVSPA